MGFFKTYKKISKAIDKAMEKKAEKPASQPKAVVEEPKVSIKVEEVKVEKPKEEPTVSRSAVDKAEYANTIFLNRFERAKSLPTSKSHFPQYVQTELGIYDPVAKFKELLKDGYLEEADVSIVLDSYKVPELKEMLAANNVSTTKRKKAEIIDVIIAEVDIKKLKLPAMYILSEKGAEYIKQRSDFLQLFNNPYGISYLEYMKARPTKYKPRFNDVVWGALNKKYMETLPQQNTTRANIEQRRAQLLESENRRVDALIAYITTLYYDMNYYIMSKRELSGLFGDEPISDFFMPPAIEKSIINLQEQYSPELIPECCQRAYIYPEPVLPVEDFRYIIEGIFNYQYISLKKYI